MHCNFIPLVMWIVGELPYMQALHCWHDNVAQNRPDNHVSSKESVHSFPFTLWIAKIPLMDNCPLVDKFFSH